MRRAWSPAAEDKLRRLYATTDLTRLAFLLKRSEKAIRSRAKVLGLKRGTRRPWTDVERRILRKRYATETCASIARDLGRSESTVYQQAQRMGLSKPDGWAAETTRKRWQQGRHRNSLAALAGGRGWNLGLKGSTGTHPNCRRTQFKRGQMAGAAQRNYVPIGSTRITKDGYLERKVTDDHPVPARRWVGVHRLVWQEAHGPIPPGHVVAFKPGRHSTDEARITLDALELITRGELSRRNAPWGRYPKEVTDLIRLKGRVTRQINKRSRQA